MVTPNFLCPLRLEVPARPGEVEGTHADIESQLRRSHYFRQSYLSTLHRHPVPPKAKAKEVLSREIAFRDACSAALNGSRFRDVVLGFSLDPRSLEESVLHRARLLELDGSLWEPMPDRIDDLLLAISPGVRLTLVHLPAELILRALLLFELWLRRVLTLTGTVPRSLADAATPKGATDLFGNVLPALLLLSVAGESVKLRSPARGGTSLPPFGSPGLTFGAHRILKSADGGQLEMAVVEDVLSSLPTIAEKMVLLCETGASLGVDLRKSKKAAV